MSIILSFEAGPFWIRFFLFSRVQPRVNLHISDFVGFSYLGSYVRMEIHRL